MRILSIFSLLLFVLISQPGWGADMGRVSKEQSQTTKEKAQTNGDVKTWRQS